MHWAKTGAYWMDCCLPDEEMCTVNKEKLMHLGFSFKYITHMLQLKKEVLTFFVTILDICRLDNDWFLIVKRQKKLTEN